VVMKVLSLTIGSQPQKLMNPVPCLYMEQEQAQQRGQGRAGAAADKSIAAAADAARKGGRSQAREAQTVSPAYG
jgi:hypothetical protein